MIDDDDDDDGDDDYDDDDDYVQYDGDCGDGDDACLLSIFYPGMSC